MTTPVHQTVIIGGGFTGLFTALHLSHHHYPRSIVLIEQNDRFCFKPMLYEYFSRELKPDQVLPTYDELLTHSGIIFVQDTVDQIDLQQRQIHLASGNTYLYSNLVLGLGSVTGYFGVDGAQENALPFRTQADAIALDRHLHQRLEQAVRTPDAAERKQLLTSVIIGGGPSGVELAATLADLLPQWYESLGGQPEELRIVLVNHGDLLKGDVNSSLRDVAERELRSRRSPIEILLGAEVTAIHPDALEYKRDNQTQTLAAGTILWTTGTNTHPIIKALPIPDQHRDKHGRLLVTPTLQLPDFPEVFAGGDCAVDFQAQADHTDEYEHPQPQTDQSTSAESHHPDAQPLPATAQVAYQQGAAIAYNLRSLALGYNLKPAKVNLRGTLLKLGLNNSVANVFDAVQIDGEAGHLIRQGTYLEMLPTPVHNFKATTDWIRTELAQPEAEGLKQAAQVAGVVGGVAIGAIVAKRLIDTLGHNTRT